jgi:hypothetical protein
MYSVVKNLKITYVWSTEPYKEADKLYASHKLGYNEVVKQYNISDITCIHYIGTAHYKNETTGTLWKLPAM